MIQENILLTLSCVKAKTGSCEGEPFFREHEGTRYCALHFPGPDKKEAFDAAFEKKMDSFDSNYKGVWFPRGNWFAGLEIRQAVDFSSANFIDYVSFHKTMFRSDVTFESASFEGGASFGGATFFARANFSSVNFRKEAHFGDAIFSGKVVFISANFRTKADFGHARFDVYADFRDCVFHGPVDFAYSVFRAASFWPSTFNSTASFYNASFARANFRVSVFKDKAVFSFCVFGVAEFIDTSFGDHANFSFSKFEGMANFVRATFNSISLDMSAFDDDARFTFAAFNGKTDFGYTVFKGIASFSAEGEIGGFGTEATCDFRHARFENPSRVSFHGLQLRPHWFVNVDPREFEFIDVKWIGQLRRRFIDIEIEELEKRQEVERKEASERRAERIRELSLFGDRVTVAELKEDEAQAARIEASELSLKNPRFYRLLSISCRQLAVNAEENHRYDQASDLRFWSMELQRKEGWKARGGLTIGILHTLYRYVSGYGEEILRAFLILITVFLFFAFIYTRVGFVHSVSTASLTILSDEVGQPQKPIKALAYSLAVITLQRPDPRPLTATAWFAVLGETILGPIQAALLILAVRRRFMR